MEKNEKYDESKDSIIGEIIDCYLRGITFNGEEEIFNEDVKQGEIVIGHLTTLEKILFYMAYKYAQKYNEMVLQEEQNIKKIKQEECQMISDKIAEISEICDLMERLKWYIVENRLRMEERIQDGNYKIGIRKGGKIVCLTEEIQNIIWFEGDVPPPITSNIN